MSEEQEQHLDLIVRNTNYRMKKKYRAGQAEHGGNLWDMTPLELIDNLIDEAVDQLTYALTLKQQLEEQLAFDQEQIEGEYS